MFDLIKIDFITITFLDVIDIFAVAFIIYKLYTLLKGTIASQIFVGLMIVLLLSFASQAANLKALSWLLKFITDIWIVAFIILFQPEIRRLLVYLARNPFIKLNLKGESEKIVNIIVDAAFEMSQHQHGALIVVVKSSGLRSFSESGEIINAKLTKDLLRSIFYPRSPMHDGAVIVNNDLIEAVRCTLPLSATTIVNGEALGMRHRAGLGISEIADVICVIVSEETGSISVAEEGILTKGLSKENLRNKLSQITRLSKLKSIKDSIAKYFKKE